MTAQRPEITPTQAFVNLALVYGGGWYTECEEGDEGAEIIAQTDSEKTFAVEDEDGDILVTPILGTNYAERLDDLAAQSDDVEPIPDTYVGNYAWRVRR